MLIGHKKQIKFLEDLMQTGRVSQTYLFGGPESVGKFSLAKIFAQAQITGKTDLKSETDLAVENSLDLEILVPEVIVKKGITKIRDIDVDSVRKAQERLALFPSVGKKRVLIINDAHRLTKAAQNALLKNLEEPNSSSLIILVTHRDGRILKTIKSRCQRINFNLVSLDEIKSGFGEKVKRESLEKMIIFSMGKPGEMYKFLEDENLLNERNVALKDLNLLQGMNINEKFELAQSYAKDISQATERLEFWIWMIRVQAYKNLSNKEMLRKNYLIIKRIEEVLEKMKNPSFNSRLILENLFLGL